MSKNKVEAELGEIAETLDNLHHALMLPMPADLHLKALKEALPDLRDKARRAYEELTGDNPWA
jgi:hypothetical protein